MATKKQSLVYRLPKHGYEEIDPEEWSDMAICDAYDDAVGETYIKDEKKSQDIKSTYKQFMRNSTQNTNGRLGDGDRQSPRTNHTESQNTRKRIRKEIPRKTERNVFKPGDYCVALFSEDSLYYPCTVVSVDMAKKSCLVEYAQYGNKEHVHFCDIYTEEEWESRSKEKFPSEYNEDVTSASSSYGTSSLSIGASSSTEGTSSDVTQDIYSDSRGRRKRYDSKRGSVPPYYRDVYDALCPGNNDKISRDILTQVMKKSGLDNGVLGQIWEILGSRDGIVTRTILYKTLALIAFAQQGKTVSDKLLENFSGTELPKPDLGSVHDIKAMLQQKKKSPTLLQMSFTQIRDVDKIQVSKAPEKKGIFLKHVEYEVKSSRFNSTVLRRYNDFLAFHEILQMRFPYRMLPKLPPKKVIGADRTFIEARRKSLRRYLTVVCTHPAMHQDPIVRFFLTFSGNEVVHKIKEQFRGCADEFMLSPHSNEAKSLVPADTQTQFAICKDQIKQVTSHVVVMREMTGRIAERSRGNAMDFLGFGKELISLGADQSSLSSWATGGGSGFQTLKQTFRGLSGEFGAISDKHMLQATREDEGIVEQLNLLIDLLQAFHDLCDRHERGVLREHSSALKKYGAMKNKRMAATINNSEQGAIDKIESKIVAILAEIITMLVATQAKGHREIAALWETLTPRVSALLPDTESPPSPRPVSPTSY